MDANREDVLNELSYQRLSIENIEHANYFETKVMLNFK